MTVRNLTCIICPVGCRLTVKIDRDGKVATVDGNSCPRGKKYAISEITNPVRTLTSTVRLENSSEKLLPVRTDASIPKAALFDAMKRIKTIKVIAPVKRGDIIVPNIISGANLIACANAKCLNDGK